MVLGGLGGLRFRVLGFFFYRPFSISPKESEMPVWPRHVNGSLPQSNP